MPTGRRSLAAGVINGIVYAVGGEAGGGFTNVVEAYDHKTDTWTTKAPMKAPRQQLGVGVINGILYAVGGGNNNNASSRVEAYNPKTDRWTTKAPLLTAQDSLAVGVINGKLYAVGGDDQGAPQGIATHTALDVAPPRAEGPWIGVQAVLPQASLLCECRLCEVRRESHHISSALLLWRDEHRN